MKKMSIALALTLIAGALAAWQSRETKARIPDFPMKALAMPGGITKMADEKIGEGEDVRYEMELYPDGSEVYEVYRKVRGKEMQLSVHGDRSVKYVGRELEAKELPEKVGAALRGVKGFAAEKCEFKEGPKFAEYHVRGNMAGQPYRVRISGDGRLLSVQRKLPGIFEVAVQEQ